MDGPHYDKEEFIKACGEDPSKVYIPNGPLRDAERDFGLMRKADILAVIADRELENWEWANTAPWEKNPTPEVVIYCDSYNFFFNTDYGYLKFLYNHIRGIWHLTSFKKNDKDDPRNLTLRHAFNTLFEKQKAISDSKKKE